MRTFIGLRARRNVGELLFVLLCMAIPWAAAHADPDATVDVSAIHVTFAGEFAVPKYVTTTDAQLGNTADGSVTRSAGLSKGCCGISAFASSTTSSLDSANWQPAAKSKSVIDVVDWSSPESNTWMPIPDEYDASAIAEYTIPWRVESSTLPNGTQVTVNTRVRVDGILSIEFPTNWQYYWEPGEPITPGNFEGITDHATVDVYLRIWAKRLSTGTTNGAFGFDATLNTYLDSWPWKLLYTSSGSEEYLIDESFRNSYPLGDTSAMKYRVNIDKMLTAADFEEVTFFVGEVYEVRLYLHTGASLGNHNGQLQGVKLTSDFSDTASYEMISPDGLVSFVALDSSEPPGTIDTDGDGVPDLQDVCPGGDDNSNSDGDVSPDFCDICPFDADNDADGDGVCGDVDLCPLTADSSQIDTDGDSSGDACDVCPLDANNDIDGDGVCGDVDVCPILSDPSQTDTDGDLIGDACDFDDDNDGICDGSNAIEATCTAGPDNCSLHYNSDQADFDGDGLGDVCDSDADNDTVADGIDACLQTGAGEVVATDGCSVNDLCPCSNSWKNHGAYVRCVAHASEDFVVAGLITDVEKDTIVSTAGMSICGAKK